MSQSAHATSLEHLVGRLADFLTEQQKRPVPSHLMPLPDGFARVFESFAHHLIALMLVAKSDHKVVEKERAVILDHCAQCAKRAGLDMTEAETHALRGYLRHLNPADLQLATVMERLKHDSKDEIAALIAAAHGVVEADGTVRLDEVLYLRALQDDLRALN